MSETDEMESIQRLDAVYKIIKEIRNSYPDAKRVKLDITFEWQETEDAYGEDNVELCPVVSIEIER
jgi:hypothetical protein